MLILQAKQDFTKFQRTFLWVLEKHAPTKQRKVCANEVPYMTRALRKAIMTRSRLQNRYHELKTDASPVFYRNFCNRLYKRERNVTDKKKFWKNIKPFFSSNGNFKNEITLIEGEKIISSD